MKAHTRITLTLCAKEIRKRPRRLGLAPAGSGNLDLTSQKKMSGS